MHSGQEGYLVIRVTADDLLQLVLRGLFDLREDGLAVGEGQAPEHSDESAGVRQTGVLDLWQRVR